MYYSRQNSRKPDIEMFGETLRLNNMGHARVVGQFLRALDDLYQKRAKKVKVEFGEVGAFFPNVAVPVAGLIDYFQNTYNLSIEVDTRPDYIHKSAFHAPLRATDRLATIVRVPLGKLWTFTDSTEVNTLVDSFVHEVVSQSVCEAGVIEGLTWCLNEVMDNVLVHSGIEKGFVMGQIHKTSKHIAFCIFDYGQGIFNSLRGSRYSPKYPLDAITMAVKEGVTRDKTKYQGNGMWGLHNIVRANSGIISIRSHTASYVLQNDQMKSYDFPLLSPKNGTTTVDFQIDFDTPISISDALGGHTPVSMRLESFEDDRGNMVYKIAEKASGTGTRQSGERIRNEIVNLHKETGRSVELDFSNVSIISSSFADELIGKLVVEFGFFNFSQVFRLKGMNPTTQAILDRSVSQRLAQAFRLDKDK